MLAGTQTYCSTRGSIKHLHMLLSNHYKLLIVAMIYLTSLTIPTGAYMITIDAGIENECFHERVPVGTKLGFSFEVIEGGFYDIDVDIRDPKDVILHQDERASSGKVTIEANLDGPYQFCFHNKRSSYTPKIIIFNIDKSEVSKSRGTQATDDSNNPEASETAKLDDMIGNLMLATISARHDVRYLTARDKVHRKVNEATNRTIVWWSGIEFILLMAVTLGQVWYLKRFFEIRRKA